MSDSKREDILDLLSLEGGLGSAEFAPRAGTRDEFLSRTLELAALTSPIGSVAPAGDGKPSSGARIGLIAGLAAALLLALAAVAFLWVRHGEERPPEPQPVAGVRPVVEDGFLTVETTPQTLVYIDDEMAGTTPLTRHRLSAGRHVVRVESREAGISKIYKVKVLPGKDTTIAKDLEPADTELARHEIADEPRDTRGKAAVAPPSGVGSPGRLSVATKPWTTVYIDGKKIRNTPLANHPLEPGVYTVTLKNAEQGINKTYKVQVKAGATTTLVKNLEGDPEAKVPPRAVADSYGFLSIRTKPSADVYLDGEKIGETPIVKRKIEVGIHTVTVDNPTYSIKKTYRVKIMPGITTDLGIKTLL